MTMTLEQVRDELRRPWNQTSAFAWCAQLADAIDAHLSQPQPVAQGEAVAWMWERRYSNGGYSKVTFSDEQSAREYAKDGESLTSPDLVYPLYATPTIPAGHRVVTVEPTEVAAWLVEGGSLYTRRVFTRISAAERDLEGRNDGSRITPLVRKITGGE